MPPRRKNRRFAPERKQPPDRYPFPCQAPLRAEKQDREIAPQARLRFSGARPYLAGFLPRGFSFSPKRIFPTTRLVSCNRNYESEFVILGNWKSSSLLIS